MIPHLEGLILFFHDLLKTLAANETLIKDIGGTFTSMGTALKWVAENIYLVGAAFAVIAFVAIAIKIALLTKALGMWGATLPPVAGALVGTVGPMLAFGAAVALVGAGIWMASDGIASMAKAFTGIDAGAIAAVGVALLAMGAGIHFLGTAAFTAGLPLMAPRGFCYDDGRRNRCSGRWHRTNG